jgi:hypothetical protein
MPSAGFKQGDHDAWKLLAVVHSKELGQGDVHGSSVKPGAGCGPIGPFRHLLWITEDIGEGTFFTEIDVHVAP